MVAYQSANQLKTPAKVSWDFKMVSQFGSLGYTIMGKTADLTVVQKTISVFSIIHIAATYIYIYTLYNLFAYSSCTYLLILLFIKSTVYYPAHFILLHILFFLIFSYHFMYILLCCVTIFCTVHWAAWPDLHFTTVIYYIIEYVMNKTLNPWKTISDTLDKEGKPQTFIAKEAGCSQSAVSKHVNRKLSGRKKCGRKRYTTNQENRSLMRIVKQNRFKNFGELHKEWTEAGVKASRATTHRRVKEFVYSCR